MKEPRRDVRIIEGNRVVIEMSGEEKGESEATFNGFTKNLSLRGAMLEANKSFLPETELIMTLYLTRSSQVVRVRGRIKWVKQIAQGVFRIGIEFIHETPGAYISLLSHLFGKQTEIPTTIHV